MYKLATFIAFLGWSAVVVAQPPVAPAPAAVSPVELPPTVVPSPPPDPAAVEPPVAFVVPTGPKPGIYGGIDFSVLFPHVNNGVHGSVVAAPTGPVILIFPPHLRRPDTVALPSAPLEATLAPKFTLGWRLDGDRGAIQATYRNLASEGSAWLKDFDRRGDGGLSSRLDLNEVGVNYSTGEHPLGALWSLRWELGARLSTIYFDSDAFGLALGQRTTNYFIGAGPQVALDVTREIPNTGLALFSRIDTADLIGHIDQKFYERIGDPDDPTGFGYGQQGGSQAVPYLGLQGGISWLTQLGQYRATLGYEFNQWWNVARIGGSRGWIQAQGLFVRTEFNF